jgi:rhodanese-related sulfurtransferase
VGSPFNEAPHVSAREAHAKLEAGDDALLVDVRELGEYFEVRAPRATLIPLSEFVRRFGELPREQELLMICHTGQRSLQATIFLRRQGFARVANVIGGMDAWEAAGLPVERGRPQG